MEKNVHLSNLQRNNLSHILNCDERNLVLMTHGQIQCNEEEISLKHWWITMHSMRLTHTETDHERWTFKKERKKRRWWKKRSSDKACHLKILRCCAWQKKIWNIKKRKQTKWKNNNNLKSLEWECICNMHTEHREERWNKQNMREIIIKICNGIETLSLSVSVYLLLPLFSVHEMIKHPTKPYAICTRKPYALPSLLCNWEAIKRKKKTKQEKTFTLFRIKIHNFQCTYSEKSCKQMCSVRDSSLSRMWSTIWAETQDPKHFRYYDNSYMHSYR